SSGPVERPRNKHAFLLSACKRASKRACLRRKLRAKPREANVTKKILVTGGAGFIGSHLCERLIKAGEDVLCVDNYFTGSKKNVEHLLSHPLFEIMRHDVTFALYV